MHTTKRSKLKFYILGAAFVLVIAALVFLCARCAKLGTSSQSSASPVTTEVYGQDADGKDVSSKLTMTSSDQVPDNIDESTSDFLSMDISWNSTKDANFPLILTIQDPALIDDDGVAVYHYTNDAWELVGTYLIQDNSVSFQVTSLSPFALLVIDSSATASASPSPSPSASPSPSPSPTPTATPTPTPTTTTTPSPTTSATKKPTSTTSTKATTKPTTKTSTPTATTKTSTPTATTKAPTPSPSSASGSNTNPTNSPSSASGSNT